MLQEQYFHERFYTFASQLVLKIINDITDGLVILSQKGDIIFFNDVLLRVTGWKSSDILNREREFLEYLNLDLLKNSEMKVQIPDQQGTFQSFVCTYFDVQSGEEGSYALIKIKPEDPGLDNDLLEYKRNFNLLFNNIDDPLFTADLHGRILSVNKAFFRFFGYDRPDVTLPKSIVSMYAYSDELDDKLMKLLSHHRVDNLDSHLYTVDKKVVRMLDTSWAITNEAGDIIGYASQFKDVTYVKNLESRLKISERNYSILFDTILSSIILIDPEGIILNINTPAEKLYGYSRDEVTAQRFDDLFRTDKKRPSITKLIGLVDANEGKYIETEVRRIGRDGREVFTFAVYTGIKDLSGDVIAYSIVEKDLTERVRLEKKLRDSLDQVKETQAAAILGFAKLTEYRDKNTGKHIERIREYTRIIALALRELPEYGNYISDEYIEDLSLSSTLHDVGKVGIEDSILLKPGRLSGEEFDRIKTHSRKGGDALASVDRTLKHMSFLTMGKEIAYYHHERWDGKGYPEGLKGTEIPLSARIVAVADVYDALTSTRPYKAAMSHKDAVEIIRQDRGKLFDPVIIDVFMEKQDVFERIKAFIEFEENPSNIADILRDAKKKGRGKKTKAKTV
ncbi:MAG: PAS domain S-box protein [Spirochaetales bacterium]|nr:PAS domain S-box protein [Spirochaetales bacterium]